MWRTLSLWAAQRRYHLTFGNGRHPKAQAYIRALEARVAALEGMMQALQAQLK
jgi:hypothetical protein